MIPTSHKDFHIDRKVLKNQDTRGFEFEPSTDSTQNKNDPEVEIAIDILCSLWLHWNQNHPKNHYKTKNLSVFLQLHRKVP